MKLPKWNPISRKKTNKVNTQSIGFRLGALVLPTAFKGIVGALERLILLTAGNLALYFFFLDGILEAIFKFY